MSDLTDLEICKRIAEIDGVDYDYNDERVMYWSKEDAPVTTYNPLTDDALCFQLMVKYKVSVRVSWLGCDNWEAAANALKIISSPHYGSYANSANKSICLAIIEANKSISENETIKQIQALDT